MAESLERSLLIGGNLTRDAVEDTDCAQRMTFFVDQWSPRIEPEVWFRQNEWIIPESFIVQSIRYHEYVGLLNGCSAKGDFASRFGNGNPDFRLKPLPIFINK